MIRIFPVFVSWKKSIYVRLMFVLKLVITIECKLMEKISFFGRCTWCADQKDGLPYPHMMAVSMMTHRILKMTPMNIMPVWWAAEKWQLQFLLDVTFFLWNESWSKINFNIN
jgi:hypothetical protein